MMKLNAPKIVDWKYDYKVCAYFVRFKGCDWQMVSEKDFNLAVAIATTK